MFEVAILDLSNIVCVSNKTKYLSLSMFNMIMGISESKILTNIKTDHANVNVSLIEENVIQINGGIMINVDVSVKNVMYVKNML